ncbi:hypothetical protein FHS82_002372 [Pseudochelatococcus lubricantis]|uniref:Flagellar protein FliT n=1 Tax=Pseudochelatococcus lubricantis TaxID=1538102 RepID=A0ABX0V351_9HYPH|nr:hypothetical protein [Pseudochelatococcus lubricantis]NIJ58524.1 hypothetical protein [Pseudochelatococcus lubricantis]
MSTHTHAAGQSASHGLSGHDDTVAVIGMIEDWLAERGQRPGQDWHGLLTTICDRLRQIRENPVMRDDPVVRRVFDDMLAAEGIAGLAAQIDRLGVRAAYIIARLAEAGPIGAARAPSLSSPKKPAGRITLRL